MNNSEFVQQFSVDECMTIARAIFGYTGGCARLASMKRYECVSKEQDKTHGRICDAIDKLEETYDTLKTDAAWKTLTSATYKISAFNIEQAILGDLKELLTALISRIEGEDVQIFDSVHRWKQLQA